MNIWRIAQNRRLSGLLFQASLHRIHKNSAVSPRRQFFHGYTPPTPATLSISVPLASLSLALLNCSTDGNKVGYTEYIFLRSGSHFSVQEKLLRAVQRGNVAEVERLIRMRNVDVNCRHELGWTPLHLAAVNGRQEVGGRDTALTELLIFHSDCQFVDISRGGRGRRGGVPERVQHG